MSLQILNEVNLSVSSFSEVLELNGKGPISIQPISFNVIGTPTYTLSVSNDDPTLKPFSVVDFDILSTALK